MLLLADATGHGIGPALSVTQLRAMLRMAVRAGLAAGGSASREVAQHINEQLYADLPSNRFITAWLAMLDAAAGTLTTYSAGQAPLLLYRAGHRFDPVADPLLLHLVELEASSQIGAAGSQAART